MCGQWAQRGHISVFFHTIHSTTQESNADNSRRISCIYWSSQLHQLMPHELRDNASLNYIWRDRLGVVRQSDRPDGPYVATRMV
jgi:hypothetical protein